MHSSARLRRTVAVSACVGLTSALAWLPVGASALGPPVQIYVTQGVSNAASGCSVTSGSANVFNTPKPLQNGRAKGAVNLVATWTNGSDSTDITSVSGHYAGSTHLVKQHGAFSTATVSGSGHLAVTRALGGASTCDVSAQLLNAVEFVSTQPAGWYYTTRTTVKGSLTETVVSANANLSHPILFEAYQGGANHVTQRAFVKQGTYVTAFITGIEAGDYPLLIGSRSGRVAGTATTNTVSAAFHKAGAALAGTSGSGATFVTLPASVSCSHGTAKLTWKSRAGRVASGSFFVNGKRQVSVSNPQAGRHVVLRHLGKTADNTITAKLALKGGGRAAASRVYVPCQG